MKEFTFDDILSWPHCDHLEGCLPKDWRGTVLDILSREDLSPQKKLWISLRRELLEDKTLRLFSVFCAKQIEHLLLDERDREIIGIAEKFSNGDATEGELRIAYLAALKLEQMPTNPDPTFETIANEAAINSLICVTNYDSVNAAMGAAANAEYAICQRKYVYEDKATWDAQIEKLRELILTQKV
jgi:hypothetical protein